MQGWQSYSSQPPSSIAISIGFHRHLVRNSKSLLVHIEVFQPAAQRGRRLLLVSAKDASKDEDGDDTSD